PNALLTVVHERSEDGTRTFANIRAINPLPDGAAKLRPANYTRHQDRGAYGQPRPPAAQPTPPADEPPFDTPMPEPDDAGVPLSAADAFDEPAQWDEIDEAMPTADGIAANPTRAARD